MVLCLLAATCYMKSDIELSICGIMSVLKSVSFWSLKDFRFSD